MKGTLWRDEVGVGVGGRGGKEAAEGGEGGRGQRKEIQQQYSLEMYDRAAVVFKILETPGVGALRGFGGGGEEGSR